MHQEVLSPEQKKLLPFISEFSKQYYLVGGTAIALQIGHRRSIDFDLFTDKKIRAGSIKFLLKKKNIEYKILHEAFDQFHIYINSVKLTFFEYPYRINAKLAFNNIINMPELIDLSAMKAIALGGRAKWKDYVDMYFILKSFFSLTEIENKTSQIFQDAFNPKLLKQQLAYFNDIDYSEEIEFMPGYEINDNEIRQFLTEIATRKF